MDSSGDHVSTPSSCQLCREQKSSKFIEVMRKEMFWDSGFVLGFWAALSAAHLLYWSCSWSRSWAFAVRKQDSSSFKGATICYMQGSISAQSWMNVVSHCMILPNGIFLAPKREVQHWYWPTWTPNLLGPPNIPSGHSWRNAGFLSSASLSGLLLLPLGLGNPIQTTIDIQDLGVRWEWLHVLCQGSYFFPFFLKKQKTNKQNRKTRDTTETDPHKK